MNALTNEKLFLKHPEVSLAGQLIGSTSAARGLPNGQRAVLGKPVKGRLAGSGLRL